MLDTPAITVKAGDKVEVDGQPLPERDRTRLWLFHKPRGNRHHHLYDPEGRPTVFSILPEDLPRVMTIGRLDINTEGLLLTNDGGLARILEQPATGWLRRYRVRAHGDIDRRGSMR